MSTSWDPYGSSGGSVTHSSASSSGPIISHGIHLPHHQHMTSSTAAIISSPSVNPQASIYSHAGSGGIINMPPGTSSLNPISVAGPPLRGHPVTSPQPNYIHPPYPHSGYVPHLSPHGQPHGSPHHHVPQYSGTPVIHPYPPPCVTTTNQSSNPYHHPLAPVPPLPGTAPLPPPLGVPPYNPGPYPMSSHPQPSHHIPLTTQPTTLHHAAPHLSHPQPYNLKVTGSSPQPICAPLTPGPMPQTPIGGPPSAPFANGPPGGPEHDLPPELLSAGWRKFWSKRENRWYFWNCNTGESLWELPPLPGRYPPPPQHGVYDPLTDPLGISCANGPGGANHLKRRASSGEPLGSPVVKKFIVAGPWDLEIYSNVYSSEAAIQNPLLLPPHPDVELERAKWVAKLRQCYQQACQSREGIDAPKESLNRWIMERKISDLRGVDPVFPACDASDGVVSQLMFKEIMNDIPMKVVKPRYTGDARKQLAKYAEACKRIIETRDTTSEARKLVKWKVEETFSWLKATVGAPYEAFQERLAHLKVTCQPHVHAAAKTSVEGICKKMSLLAKQYGQTVREAHLKHFADPQNVKQNHEPEKGRYRCHPALCGGYVFSETGKLPAVEYIPHDKDLVALKYKNDVVRISSLFLQKLEQLYRYNCVDDRKFEFFLVRCFSLLKRYNSYCEDYSSSNGTQSSLPVTVFESIQRNFGVTFECFASPLNCYFRQFCSAFPDIDGYFGSRGTFLDYKPVTGSFQMNPPFSEDLMDAAITHAENLLAGTKESISFIIFVPEWSEEKENIDSSEVECPWIKRLSNSRWNRKQVTISAFEHEFRHAAQHVMTKSEVSVRCNHNTVVFWLQNDAGFEEWKPTDERVDALTDAYRPGRERERDRQELLAPERQNPHQADKAVAAAVAAMNSA
ncbi:unnamed protein product [Orchesella dallaii]|uniref:WW domain-containing protein n=1 Tax=Orchesella dallaii TaxID=48710 RepID=A0ABP1QKJ1_9HEXA